MLQAFAPTAIGGSAPGYVEISFGNQSPGSLARQPFQPRVEDKRGSPRRRVLLSALVVNREFNAIFRCRVHDVSETGARLQIAEGFLLPQSFWMIAISSGLAYESKTAWRRYPNIGVEVGEPIDLNDPVTRIGRRLRFVWQSVAR